MSILLPGSIIKGRKTVKDFRFPTDQEAMEICKGMSEALSTIYHGYVWCVQIQQDVVSIINYSVNRSCGCRVPLSEIDVEGKVLMRLGGEILERYGLRRGKRDNDGLNRLHMDPRGNAIQLDDVKKV